MRATVHRASGSPSLVGEELGGEVKIPYEKARCPVISRPTISDWMVSVPS
jgi:hypothetical protein